MTNKNLLIVIAVLALGVLIAMAMDTPVDISQDSEARVVVSNAEERKG